MASSKRERELARQRAARQAARRAERERRRKRRNSLLAAVTVLALLVGVGAFAALSTRDSGEDTLAVTDPTPSPGAESEPTAEPTAAADPSAAPAGDDGGCTYEPGREPARPVEPPGPDVDRTTPYRAVLDTNEGQIAFDLRTADAPCTVHSLRSLAAQDFFDDTPCHRLTTSGIFVLQCGDPSGTGTGGPGYSFADENLEGATYERGTVAMANSGEDTNGSQFFLVYQDSQLPPQYTPFGRLTEESLAVLDRVAAAGSAPPASPGGNTAPNLPVQIADLRVEPAA